MSNPKQQAQSVHDLIEEARAIIITVSAANYGAQQITEDKDFSFCPEVSGTLLGRANELLLDAAEISGGDAS